MRISSFFAMGFLVLLNAGQAAAADPTPGEAAIKTMLVKQKNWVLHSEYTDAATPGDRAQKLKFEYSERDTKLMGRWLVDYGGCEFELALRPDGFSFPWCPPYNGVPMLDYDPADTRYPFKSRNPRKLWLEAAD